ncbi:aspartate--tRNA ligase, partial [Candidatus Woesearchaeota archaeon]|nr:aspartate--tRNA ligase [Candidatus Woesearchaeota archaeon]
RKENVDESVVLNGWVHSRRDHGGIIFIDLRDRYGLTQVVFDPNFNNEFMSQAESLRREFCIEVKGVVKARREGMNNPNLPTGDVEVFVSELKIINKSDIPPIEVDDRKEASEEVRLKYRFLDLRRPTMQNKLLFRHNVAKAAREFFNKNDFMEIETPLLVKSTPEGARDYVVPSRVNPGLFYALPQSPQLYKQMLMISGCDRYYQLARCLRDEDLRSDRQPEHTQIDLEMSFVTADELRGFVEKLMAHIFKETLDVEIKVPFTRLTYKESMAKYGNDKPDLRYELELTDITNTAEKSDFSVFKEVVANGGIVKCVNPEKELGRKEIDKYIEFCQQQGAKGMAWVRVTETGLESSIAKFLSDEVQQEIIQKTGAKPGSVLMFIADTKKKTNFVLSRLRNKLADDLELYNKKDFEFCWIYDFPLFAWNEDDKRWEPEHHIFSMPKPEFVDDFEERPGDVLGDLWDLVLNGTEMSSGSIRVSDPQLQSRMLNFIGIAEEEAEEKFGFLLNAYKYGGPSHGGVGIGLDRLVAMMIQLTDIREVMAFPKNKNAECPMDESPNKVSDLQMKELHLQYDDVAKKNLEKKSEAPEEVVKEEE